MYSHVTVGVQTIWSKGRLDEIKTDAEEVKRRRRRREYVLNLCIASLSASAHSGAKLIRKSSRVTPVNIERRAPAEIKKHGRN